MPVCLIYEVSDQNLNSDSAIKTSYLHHMLHRPVLLSLLVLIACSPDPEPVNEAPVAALAYHDDLDRITLTATDSQDPEHAALSYLWSTTSTDITIEHAGESVAYFMLPEGETDQQAEITLKVGDGHSEDVVSQNITVPPLTQVRSYGLGRRLAQEASNNRNYDWYLDQSHSGVYNSVNCGPASVTMSIKWFDEEFKGTMEDARATYHASGGWWYTNDIINYLDSHEVTNFTIALNNIELLKDQLDLGNVIILCLDMYYVQYNDNVKERFGKFYTTNGTGWGHFIVVKGYKKVDDRLFFEVYDPYSFDRTYTDGVLKGKDRYYPSADLNAATNVWWDYAIVISKDGSTGRRGVVDNAAIPHKPGR